MIWKASLADNYYLYKYFKSNFSDFLVKYPYKIKNSVKVYINKNSYNIV